MENICCLVHTTFIEYLENIISDGYLKSPKDTGNYCDSNYYGEDKIHFRALLLKSDVELYHSSCALILDKNLILRKDCRILDFSKDQVLEYQKRPNLYDKLGPHNDIMFSTKIPLKKYLKKIIIFKDKYFEHKNISLQVELIKKMLQKYNFNNVKIIIRHSFSKPYFYKKRYRYENNILWNYGGAYLKYDPQIC